MRVLILGPHGRRLGHVVGPLSIGSVTDPCTPALVRDLRVDFLVSYGYRHMVTAEVLEAVGGQAVNLHISYLPWNRGADPNLWSWLTGTPKGASVHWMTAGLDQGPLIGQRRVEFRENHTLSTAYDVLQDQVVEVFAEVWPAVLDGTAPRITQPAGGSFHSLRDKEPHMSALHSGWDTPCREVEQYGRRAGLWIGEPSG